MSVAAARVRARVDPAIGYPPLVQRISRKELMDLTMTVDGVQYKIGPAIEGDPQTAGTIDGVTTISIDLRDPESDIAEILAEEDVLLAAGVTITLADIVYQLQSLGVDESTGTLVTLVVEDQVATRMRQYTSYLAIPRAKYTRAEAALQLVAQASASPLAPIAHYIPQLTDKQRIASGGTSVPGTPPGTGAGAYTVKGVAATAAQRSVIDGILTEAAKKGASDRVMVASIMAATQESTLTTSAANSGHIGPFQQADFWGSVSTRMSPSGSAGLFLDQWAFVHGSTKSAPGNLADDIEAVQKSGQGSLYGAWTAEATKTVATWQGTGNITEQTVIEPFYFERGQKNGQQESSWDATGDWATDVNWHRWAERNTFFFASEDELRNQAPTLTVKGNEPWLIAPPAYSWNPNRAVQEVTLVVLADRWSGGIGSRVDVAGSGPTSGIMLVTALAGYLVSPELTITLGRPSTKLPEPANQTQEVSTNIDAGGLFNACQAISDENHPYLLGGGHGVPLKSIKPGDPLDCSSSVSLALYRAGLFSDTQAWVSGQFASSFGVAGHGNVFTIMASPTHVFILFEGDVTYKRFDTVGPGASGPHLRTSAPPEPDRFTARHLSGH